MNKIRLLREFGFSDYEIKVYIALAQKHSGKVSEIAKDSGVPQNKVYGCLSKLVEKGYITELEVSPREYKILNLGQFKEHMEKREQNLKEMKREVAKLERDFLKNKESSECIATVFRGYDKIVQLQNQYHQKLSKYQYSLVGGTSFQFTSARLIKEAIKRGVEHRFLTYYDYHYDDIYRKWKEAGVKIRFHNREEWKSIRFSTLDEKWCRITFGKPQISDHKDYLTFWFESQAFATLLKDIFLKLWDDSTELQPKD